MSYTYRAQEHWGREPRKKRFLSLLRILTSRIGMNFLRLLNAFGLVALPSVQPGGRDIARAVRIGSGLLSALLLFLLCRIGNLSSVLWIGGSVCGYMGPMWIDLRKKTRICQAFERCFPDVLEWIAMGIDAGLNLDRAVEIAKYRIRARSDRDSPERIVVDSMAQLTVQIRLGRDQASALESLAHRIPISAVQNFVQACIQSCRNGNPIAETLVEQSVQLRTAYLQRLEEQASKSSVAMLIPLGLLFIVILSLVLGPFLVQLMSGKL